MKLITESIRRQLLANWRDESEDHKPAVKFFNPAGAATWLFTELNPEDGDTLFGLCDLGFGTPELGYASLRELADFRGRFGLGIERDRHFKAAYPLSVYTAAARAHSGIVENDRLLAQAAA